MAASRGRVRFQRQMKRYHEHCCVPQCSASSKYNGLLSFHGFPRDPALRRRWLQNIRREEMKLTQHSKVCSLHFSPDQLLRPRAAGGRRAVSRGAVPVLFPWSPPRNRAVGTGQEAGPARRTQPPGSRLLLCPGTSRPEPGCA
ncbi:THAP domain-containing protein 3-like [Poeciliopsis prolifica]|uniref:THAP domain-containing protein 3-like n=1 Tax=Poeciliopsis prolifica TaxID=188132 RepID=UPI002413EFE4|nr:THAP domain-containing protein 3-like [Poeciliopsis prolifica]